VRKAYKVLFNGNIIEIENSINVQQKNPRT